MLVDESIEICGERFRVFFGSLGIWKSLGSFVSRGDVGLVGSRELFWFWTISHDPVVSSKRFPSLPIRFFARIVVIFEDEKEGSLC